MTLKQETKANIAKTIEFASGISYEEFQQLDSDEQQKLIALQRRKQKRKDSDEVIAMIGSGADSIFVPVKKGDIVMLGSGENSCFEGVRKKLNDEGDDLYSRPVAFVKKLQRRIRNKYAKCKKF